MKPWISLAIALVLGHVTVLAVSQKSLESKSNETNLMVNDDPCLKSDQQVKPDLTQKDTVEFYVDNVYSTRLTRHKECLDKSGGTEYYRFTQDKCVSCEQDSYEAVFCWGYINDKKNQAVKAELKEELVIFKTQHDKLLNDSVHSLKLLRGEMKVVSEQNLNQKKDFKSVVEDLRFEIVKLHGKTNSNFGIIVVGVATMLVFIAIYAVTWIRGRSESRSGSSETSSTSKNIPNMEEGGGTAENEPDESDEKTKALLDFNEDRFRELPKDK